ncbi:ABC transporter substrate-binding protein [Clostridium sp. Cult1]|uniref:ABC transporter substrate-binding protein n=1 Tax=Clostridium sp. Cult1 TaxID=2079002 RepID=UPI001F2EF427|nr:ABC transporter substrate-binding protein [Clostridium sp. Cult1]MCF6463825.1 peptide ABC transporter [Clostridium sp. Cult1]
MKRKSLILISMMLILSLVLTACGGGKETGGKSDESTGAKDKLVIATSSDAITMDPVQNNDAFSGNIMAQVYDGLVKIDMEGNITESLAEKYEISEDGLTYTFKLKEGIKFQNGEELKASDAVFTFKRAIEAPAVAHIFGDIDPDSLEALDDYTFQFSLKEANAGIVAALCHPAAFIVNEKAVTEAGDDYSRNPIGTGPFILESWSKSNKMVLNRFEDYHGEAPVYNTLEVRVIPEATNRVIELETGGVDIAYDISPNDVSRVEENSDLQLFRTPDYGTLYMGMNTEKSPLNDIKVRQAITKAIDVESIVKAIWRGVGKPASAPYTSTIKYSIADENEPNKKDIEGAKQLLKEAGYENGLSLTITTNDRQERIDAATIMKEDLKEIGIDITVEVLEWSAFIEKIENGQHDLFMISWLSDSPDPDMVLYPCFHSSMAGPGGNYAFLNDAEVDELIIKGRRTLDGPEREQIYKDLQEKIMDLAPAVFLYNSEIVIGARNNIDNIELTPFGYHRLYHITFDK